MAPRRRWPDYPAFEPLEGRLLLAGDFVTLTCQYDLPGRLAYVTTGGRTFLTTAGTSNFLVSGEAGDSRGLGAAVLASSASLVATGYRLDVRQVSAGGACRFDVTGLAGSAALSDPQRAADLQRLLSNCAVAVVDADTAAALGAAVWEIVHETATRVVDGQVVPDYDLRTGQFRANPLRGAAWDRIANEWLHNLGAEGAGAYVLSSAEAPDFVWLMPQEEGSSSPDLLFPSSDDYASAASVCAETRTIEGMTVLVVLGTEQSDTIALSQSGSSITVTTPQGGQSYDGAFVAAAVYGFGGADTIRLDYSLTAVAWVYAGEGDDQVFDNSQGADTIWAGAGDDLLVSVGGQADLLWGGAGLDSYWHDSLDCVADVEAAETSAASVHAISQFAQPTSDPASRPSLEIAGQDLVDPTSPYSYTSSFAGQPLWVDGPEYDDIRQGSLGDCYYLAGLSSLADTDPQRLLQSITALGDGTYAVRFFDGAAAVYYRVDGQLPTAGSQPAYARLTPDGELWVALLEKAFAQFRLGKNSYDSLTNGWVQEPYRAITAGSTKNYTPSSYAPAALAQALADELAAGHAVAAGSYSPSHATYIVGNHAYSVRSVLWEDGAWYVTVYNPYGNDGAAFDDNYWDGLLKLTIDQFRDAFQLVTACLA